MPKTWIGPGDPHELAEAAQVAERELEADREEKQDDAELGENLDDFARRESRPSPKGPSSAPAMRKPMSGGCPTRCSRNAAPSAARKISARGPRNSGACMRRHYARPEFSGSLAATS